jgi:hypothetical protein
LPRGVRVAFAGWRGLWHEPVVGGWWLVVWLMVVG